MKKNSLFLPGIIRWVEIQLMIRYLEQRLSNILTRNHWKKYILYHESVHIHVYEYNWKKVTLVVCIALRYFLPYSLLFCVCVCVFFNGGHNPNWLYILVCFELVLTFPKSVNWFYDLWTFNGSHEAHTHNNP